MSQTTTTLCVECQQPTTGSVGAAGIRWRRICQPCKNKMDAELLNSVRLQLKTMDAVFGAIFPTTQPITKPIIKPIEPTDVSKL